MAGQFRTAFRPERSAVAAPSEKTFRQPLFCFDPADSCCSCSGRNRSQQALATTPSTKPVTNVTGVNKLGTRPPTREPSSCCRGGTRTHTQSNKHTRVVRQITSRTFRRNFPHFPPELPVHQHRQRLDRSVRHPKIPERAGRGSEWHRFQAKNCVHPVFWNTIFSRFFASPRFDSLFLLLLRLDLAFAAKRAELPERTIFSAGM